MDRFPYVDELISINGYSLVNAIQRNRGTLKFRELLGYNPSLWERFSSSMRSYTSRRGKKSEGIVKEILKEYCIIHNLLEPQYNVKFPNGRIIEFVCNTNKIIGIDVTNFRCSPRCIKEKWSIRNYHKHLDELWIVVFSNTLTEQDYIIWNIKSPYNVKVMSIHTFLKELDYSLDEHTKTKIDKYNQCTFHTKEEFKSKYMDKKIL